MKEAIAWANAFEFAVTLVLLDYEDPMTIAEAMLRGVLTDGLRLLALELGSFWSGPEPPQLHVRCAHEDGVSSHLFSL